ncbi:MAG: DMT family transporter [Pseudomonadota bacterium]
MGSTALPTDQKRGVLAAASGGLLLACDIPLIKLAETDPWTVLFIRGPIVLVLFFVFSQILQARGFKDAKLFHGRPTIIFALFHTVATISFVHGIFYTTTANLVFITAFSSLFALLIARIVYSERHPFITWLAAGFALFGILIITVNDFLLHDTKHLFGNLAALICALMLACEMLYARRSGKNLVFAPAFSGVFAFIVATPLILSGGITLGAPEFLLINVVFFAPVAMALLALAPRFISGPEVTLFFLLETVFAPLLVWAIFAETPSPNTLLGGVIIVMAISAHSIIQMQRQKRGLIPLR